MKDLPDLGQKIHETTQPAAPPRWLLLLAALISVLGALATVAFNEGMAFTETLAIGNEPLT